MEAKLFSEGQSVRGMPLLSFLEWARRSNEALSRDDRRLASSYGLLALPPVQRTALWTPKQVVDLWDSLFRGLPIGSFYLLGRSNTHAQGRGLCSDGPMVAIEQDGFDLFDGQQRTRAMLLGLIGPVLEKRCLWIDLGVEAKSHHIRIHLTSASQPFGYQPENGQKLPLADRRLARDKLEADPTSPKLLKKPDGKGGKRPVYDHELFELFMASDSTRYGAEPPQPHKASPSVYSLHSLLGAWRAGEEQEAGRGLEALKDFVHARQGADPQVMSRLEALDSSFRRVIKAQVALIQVEPTLFEGGKEDGRAHESLLMLFNRIGSGGTTLSDEEKLFSIYKHHQPAIHDLINDIYVKVGRVLPPTKIVASGLRIANARSHSDPLEGNAVPAVAVFAREMADTKDQGGSGRTGSLKSELERLLLPSDSAGGKGRLVACFDQLFKLLSYGDRNTLGFPRVMLATLSPQLVQVLLLWVLLVRETEGDHAPEAAQEDAVRFAMFWRLCVWNEDKASTRCFEILRSSKSPISPMLPSLYADLSGKDYVRRLATPCEMEKYGLHAPSPNWVPEEDRFRNREGSPVELYRAWWWSRGKFLLWLQRDYLAERFDNFDPASGRDDDVPYDLDHICPSSDWGRDWRPFEGALRRANCLSEQQIKSMRDARSVLGNSVGNFRLIDAPENRGYGDADLQKKMPFVANDEEPSPSEQIEMARMAFDPEQRAVWLKASGQDKQWDAERLSAFQEAVEQRTLWLYRRFYTGLGFSRWRDLS